MTDIYYGTKKITAWHAEKDSKPGYAVKYNDGYTSWSPSEAFEEAYRTSGKMNFGHALFALKEGAKIARKGWNGKGMFLIYVPGTPDVAPREGTPYHKALSGQKTSIDAHVDMYTAGGTMQPGWLASQADLLAEDWEVIE